MKKRGERRLSARTKSPVRTQGPKQLCQSVGRKARRANTSDKPERSSHTFGDDRKPELSASCLTAFVRRLRPLGPISAPANPHQVRPTGKEKGIWVRRPNCKSVDAERSAIHWATPRGYESNRRSHSNHCGGDRDRVRPTSRPSSKLAGCGRVRMVD